MSEPRVNQQSAVDTWYLRFLKNLEADYHAELAWNLIMMGRATAAISINVYKPFLNRYKDEIIKAMLTAIANKDTELNYSDRELNELLVGARKLGVDWPELDIMERSVKADHNLSEARKMVIPDTEEGRLALVRRDPHAVQWIPNPSEQVKMEAVSYNGYAIQGIKNPSEEIKLAAVERNGAALECIKDPSDAVKLAAVKSDGSAIYYIKNPTDEMKRAAVESWPLAIGYIRNPSDELQVLAILKQPNAINHIKRPSLDAQLTAMKKSATMILRIKKIDPGLWDSKRVKVKVLKQMLRWMKGRNQEDAAMMAKHLRANACPWPELEIILKSLKTDKLIREETDSYVDDRIKSFIMNQFKSGYMAVMQAMDQHGIMVKDMPEAAEYLEGCKKSMVRTILRKLLDRDYVENIESILALARAVELDWPELDIIEKSLNSNSINEGRLDAEERRQAREYIEGLPFLADSPGDCMYVFSFGYDHGDLFDRDLKPFFQPHREAWIRFLLEELKFGDDHDEIGNAVDILRNRIGLDWPELDIIIKSLKTDKLIKEATYSYNNLPKTEKGWMTAVSKKPDLILYKDSPSEALQLAAVSKDPWLIKHIWKPSEAAQLVSVQHDGYNISNIKNPSEAVQLAAVKQAGSSILLIRNRIQKLVANPEAKHPIISATLKAIQKNDRDAVKQIVKKLRRNGCTWPELDVIERSLRSDGMIKEADSEHDEYLGQLMRYLKSYLLDKQYADTFEIIQEIASMDDVPHDLKALLDSNKHGLLKRMLEFIKYSESGNFMSPAVSSFDARSTIDGLQSLGVDWPELKAINKSIRANRSLREDTEDINTATVAQQIRAVKQNPSMISRIKNPAEPVQIAAVRHYGTALKYIENPTEKVQLAAMAENGWAIMFIKDPSETVKLAAVAEHGSSIEHIENPSEAVQLAAVENYPDSIGYIKNPSEAVKLAAVKRNWYSITYIKEQSAAVQIAAVVKNPQALEYIKDPKPELWKSEEAKTSVLTFLLKAIKNGRDTDAIQMMGELLNLHCPWSELKTIERSFDSLNESDGEKDQLAAVEMDPYSIKDMASPSEAVQLAAVRKNGYAIQHIKNPSDAVKLAAVTRSGPAIKYIDNPSKAMQMAAVRFDGAALAGIKDPEPDVVEAAVRNCPRAIMNIKDPSRELQLLAVNSDPNAIAYIVNALPEVQIRAVLRAPAPIMQRIRQPSDELWANGKVKEKVLRFLLGTIKDNEFEDYRPLAKHLIAVDCPWPELKMIERSLRADNKLRESTNEVQVAINTMADALDAANSVTYTNIFPLNTLARLERLVREGEASVDDITPGLNGIKDKILTYMLRQIRNGKLINYGMDLPQHIVELRNLGIDWPELTTIERSIKIDVRETDDPVGELDVPDVLDAMTNGAGPRLGYLAGVVKTFDASNLELLKKGMSKSKHSIMVNLIDMCFTPDPRSLKHMKKLLVAAKTGWPEFADIPNSLLPVLSKEFEEKVTYGGITEGVNALVALKEAGVNTTELAKRFKTTLVPDAVSTYASDPHTPIYTLTDDLHTMLDLGVPASTIKPILDQRQQHLIRLMLAGIRDRQYMQVNLMISGLRELDVDWPDLDVIEKTMQSGSLYESERTYRYGGTREDLDRIVSDLVTELKANKATLAVRGALSKMGDRYGLSNEEIAAFFDPIMDLIEKKISTDLGGRSISIGIKDLGDLARYDLVTDALRLIAENNKDTIIRFVLGVVREKQSVNIALKYVELLERAGLEWSEFQALRRAAQAEHDELMRRRAES